MKISFGKRMVALTLSLVVSTGLLAACGTGGGGGGGAAPAAGGAAAAGGTAPEAAADPEQTVTLRFANIFAADAYQSRAMQRFKELVEDRNPNITIDLFHNAILGNETELGESVTAGTVDMVAVGTAINMFVPNVFASEIPFLFEDWDHYYNVITDQRYIDLISRGMENHNIMSLGFSAVGARQISSNVPIHSMADFDGLRLRVPNIPIFLQMGEAFGANHVALPIVELFTALEQGVVDAQENAYNVIIANRLYEVQQYFIETNHMQTTHMWYMNIDAFNALTPENQEIIRESAREALRYGWDILVDGHAEEVAYLESLGRTIIIPDDQFREDLREAMQSVWEWFSSENPDGDEIFALVEQIRLGN